MAAVLTAALQTAAAEDGAPTEDQPPSRVVMLSDRVSEETNADVFQAVIGQLSDTPVELSVEWLDELPPSLDGQLAAADRIAARRDTLAVFWIVSESEEQLLLHIADAMRRRILVRRLARSEAGAQYEALALIVRASIDALLGGGVIGIEAPRARAPEPVAPHTRPTAPPRPAEPVAEETRPPWLGLEAGYDLAVHSREHPLLHGVHLALSANPHAGLIARVAYVLRTPLVVEDNRVTILVEHHPVSAGLGYQWRIDGLILGGTVSLLLDYVVQTSNRLISKTGIASDNSDLLMSVAPSLDLGYELNDRVALRLSVGPEIIINNIRYIYEATGGREVVLEPWWVQPRIFAGVGVWMF
jgi:hypothetical protein